MKLESLGLNHSLFFSRDVPEDKAAILGLVVIGTSAGKLHEIFWKSATVGIEGHDDLPVSFDSVRSSQYQVFMTAIHSGTSSL